MAVIKFIAVELPIALGVVMIGTGGLNFAGPPLAEKTSCSGVIRPGLIGWPAALES